MTTTSGNCRKLTAREAADIARRYEQTRTLAERKALAALHGLSLRDLALVARGARTLPA